MSAGALVQPKILFGSDFRFSGLWKFKILKDLKGGLKCDPGSPRGGGSPRGCERPQNFSPGVASTTPRANGRRPCVCVWARA